jgi:hypothetical protein
MAKISHTKLKQPSFGEKKVKINLHQNFPIYDISDIAIQVYVKLFNTILDTEIVPEPWTIDIIKQIKKKIRITQWTQTPIEE